MKPDSQQRAWARLFSESQQALKRYARRLVHSSDAADDIVQEAFLRTYEHGDRVRSPRAVLFSAARNLAIDARRHAQIARTDSLGEMERLAVVAGGESPEGPEKAALAEEEGRLLKEAIARLPPKCRAVFALRVFHALSYQEIARRLSISEKTVEKHVAQGIRETHRYFKRRHRTKA